MFDTLSKREQLIFLAGIFEGEGWFGANKTPKTPVAVLEVQMSDEDVIKRFQRYHNLNSNIWFKKREKKHYKDCWRFYLKGYRALHFMEAMLPYLGKRRQKQYYDVVKIIGDGPKNWSPPVSEQAKNQTSDVRCTAPARRKNESRGDSLRG
jgi:hypothetical protein